MRGLLLYQVMACGKLFTYVVYVLIVKLNKLRCSWLVIGEDRRSNTKKQNVDIARTAI